MTGDEIEAIEIDLLLEGLRRCHGYDFRDYSRASLARRVRRVVALEKLATVSDLQRRVLHEPATVARIVAAMSVHATSMFRDPEVHRALRAQIVPILRTYPLIRVWHAGCATGEEVYSLAILLHEEGLLDRSRLYATDISSELLERAASGTFPLESMRENTRNYQLAGGKREFSAYYTTKNERARFRPELADRMVFASHNLVTDSGFNEFNLIMCRNVLLYFGAPLRARVHGTLYDSLTRFGFLCLGVRESLQPTPLAERYRELSPGLRVFRKVG